MTAIAHALQAPILPPKAIEFWCDEYFEDRVEVCTDNACFVVEHSTDVEKEPVCRDCWSYDTDSHYTEVTGYAFLANTSITSVKLLVVEGVETDCIKDKLSASLLNQIQCFIESLAAQHAKDADDE